MAKTCVWAGQESWDMQPTVGQKTNGIEEEVSRDFAFEEVTVYKISVIENDHIISN